MHQYASVALALYTADNAAHMARWVSDSNISQGSVWVLVESWVKK